MSLSPHSGNEENSPLINKTGRNRSASRSLSRDSPKRSRKSRSREASYKSRSVSRSRSRTPERRSHRYSRSRSSRDRRRRYSRSRSHDRRSPRRNSGREDPRPNRCLGVFGLSLYTTERQLHGIFSKYGNIDKVQVVLDAKTGRSRGFAFVYYDHVEDATDAKNSCSGMEIDGRRIRADYSVTERPHTPTPGIYMGRPTYTHGSRSGRYGGGGGYGRRRSPSPYHRRRSYRSRSRSRSRSYSPRRYRY